MSGMGGKRTLGSVTCNHADQGAISCRDDCCWGRFESRAGLSDICKPDADLHDKIPVLSPDLIAAEVEITTDVRSTPSPPLEARIISMIQGKYAGSLLRIEPQVISSCDGFPYPGQRGIVVGRVVQSSDGVLVIDPIRAPSANQIREDKAVLSNKPT